MLALLPLVQAVLATLVAQTRASAGIGRKAYDPSPDRLLGLLYALGFALFSVTLAKPAGEATRTEAVVVLTGGKGRIERGMAVMKRGEGKRMLISGADPSVTRPTLRGAWGAVAQDPPLLRRSWLRKPSIPAATRKKRAAGW